MSEATKNQSSEPGRNILKSRDDPQPVSFETVDVGKFKLCPDSKCSWLKKEEEFGPDKLRPRIEPWLTALFQSEHHSLLIGSGLTHSVHWMAKGSSLPGMAKVYFNVFDAQISEAANATAKNAGRNSANIEDQIRVANELLSGLDHYCSQSATFRGSGKLKEQIKKLREDISKTLNDFAASILDGERSIVSAIERERERLLAIWSIS